MANILETFFILFESDAGGAKKDVDGLNKSLRNTSTQGQKAVNAGEELSNSFRDMGRSAIGAIGGVLALSSIISSTIESAANLDALGKFSQSIGENVADINAWEEAVIRSGGSADSFRQSISTLNEQVVDASIKGMNEIVPFFNQLGISIVDTNGKAKSTLDLLPELADAFENIDKQESIGIGKKLGLDQATILLLQSGRREVEALLKRQRELGVASAEAVEVSQNFNDSLADFRQSVNFGSQSLLISFLPSVTSIIDKLAEFSRWMVENKTLVQGFFIGLGAAIAKFAIPPLVALLAPFITVTAAITALSVGFGLLYEDIQAFKNGQDSLIGDMLKKWPELGNVIQFFGDYFKNLTNLVYDFLEVMRSAAGFIADVFTAPEVALKKLSNIGGFAKSLFGFGDDSLLNAQQSISAAATNPISSQTSNSIQNSVNNRNRQTSVKTGDIVINTNATDADGIASEAAGSLNRQLRTTIDNFDDGVLI